MMQFYTINSEFQQILTAAKERRGDLSVDTYDCVLLILRRCECSCCVEELEFYAQNKILLVNVVSLFLASL